MKFLRFTGLFLVVFLSSCKDNALDPEVDCSTSTLDFNYEIVDADCGQSNGSIIIATAGGVPPYMYDIGDSISRTSGTIDKLGAGNYIIIVTDNVNCSVSKEVLITSKNGFSATANLEPSGCKASNGVITVQPVNGVSPYSYRLDNLSQANATFSNLAAGQHEVLITDAIGCDFSMIETVLTGVSYAATIKPIMANNCTTTSCHNGAQFPDLRTYEGVKANTKNIREFTQSGFMPRNGSLTQAEKDAIACWIDDGAFDN